MRGSFENATPRKPLSGPPQRLQGHRQYASPGCSVITSWPRSDPRHGVKFVVVQERLSPYAQTGSLK